MIKALVALFGDLGRLAETGPTRTRMFGEETLRLSGELDSLRSRFPETPAEAGRRRRRRRDGTLPPPGRRTLDSL